MVKCTEVENTWQKRTVAIICTVGIAHCIICLLPLAFNVSIKLDNTLTLAHSASHVAAIAAAFPLVCDYVCDFSLPKKLLIYPRGFFMVALLVPSAVILLMNLQGPCVRISVCLHYASEALFNAGISAFLAGEVGDKRLLLMLSLETVCSSVRNLFFVYAVFSPSPINGPRILLVPIACYLILYFTMLVLLVLHMKTLNERRKHFIKVYLTSCVALAILRVGSFATLHALDLDEYVKDASLLIQILITTGVSLATSRMGQHDAIVAQVSKANSTTIHSVFVLRSTY
jgi:hypothetical protein